MFKPLTRSFYRLPPLAAILKVVTMVVEVTRLLLGVLIAIFHRPLAAKIMEQERALDMYFRQRGVRFPAPPSDTAAQNLYFVIGISICLFEAGKIWISMNY